MGRGISMPVLAWALGVQWPPTDSRWESEATGGVLVQGFRGIFDKL